MSLSKPLTVSRLNDLLFGSFSLVQPSPTLDHLVRYLGTWSGSDKLFMIIQYSIKIIVPLLNLRARLRHRAGLCSTPKSSSAAAYAKFGSLLGNSRTLWRIWGLLPIIQWLISLERTPKPTRHLLMIERIQGWSMLAYYPLEHISYLMSHGLLPSSIPTLSSLFSSSTKRIKLNANTLGIWSTRFWALYVLLQLAHLRQDRKLLQVTQRNLRKAKGAGPTQAEKQELKERWDAFWSEVITNLAYLPLTIHWSSEEGIITNDVWVGILGLIAALTSFRSGWKATALPSSPPALSTAGHSEETGVQVETISSET